MHRNPGLPESQKVLRKSPVAVVHRPKAKAKRRTERRLRHLGPTGTAGVTARESLEAHPAGTASVPASRPRRLGPSPKHEHHPRTPTCTLLQPESRRVLTDRRNPPRAVSGREHTCAGREQRLGRDRPALSKIEWPHPDDKQALGIGYCPSASISLCYSLRKRESLQELLN